MAVDQGDGCLVVRAAAGADAGAAADLLWRHGARAVEEREPAPGTVELVAGFDSAGARAEAATAAGRRWAVRIEAPPEGWADAWRAWATPVRVGRSLVVHPAWVEAGARPGDTVVELDPGRSFGTGAHPSTYLCLERLVRHVRAGDRVLDVGCGSGVLSVVAARLGAGEVVAVDVDPAAVRDTGANATRNGVGDVVRASTTAAARVPGAFDLVVANLGGVAAVLELAPALVACVRPGGLLVVSGLLDEPAGVATVRRAIGGGRAARRDGWAALTWRRP